MNRVIKLLEGSKTNNHVAAMVLYLLQLFESNSFECVQLHCCVRTVGPNGDAAYLASRSPVWAQAI